MDKKFFLKPWLRNNLKKILPEGAISALRRIQNFFYSHTKFSYDKAQKYELEHSIYSLKRNEIHFENAYSVFEYSRKNTLFDSDFGAATLFFNKDIKQWEKFCQEIKDKICLEIGSGPMGLLTGWHWIRNRIIIDPLVIEFKKTSLEVFGKTFLTDDIKLYSQKAEIFIKDLDNKINGCIISTNALDHSENPILILENISKYAASGCLFFFWSTLYYPKGHNEGHRNVIESKEKFEKLLYKLGFKIISVVSEDVLPKNDDLVYGCVAIKI